MIDSPAATERLIVELREGLPFFAKLTPVTAAIVKERVSDAEIPERCEITRVEYAGDAGGIMCHFAVPSAGKPRTFIVSLTHLSFDHAAPAAHRIFAYRQRRIERLRREGNFTGNPRVTDF